MNTNFSGVSFRLIPSVNEVLKHRDIQRLLERYPRTLVVNAVRQILDEHRQKIRLESKSVPCMPGKEVPLDARQSPPQPEPSLKEGDTSPVGTESETLDRVTRNDLSIENIISEVENRVLHIMSPSLCPVINATGVPLHTNLGRAPVSYAAAQAIYNAALNYVNLELDLETGKRGSRQNHLVRLICDLTGAEDALVVNNNAASIFLCLNTFADGREVIVSRGELVEIGGSFRLPDIMKKSGATLVEVGTTNRTYIEDYADAISDRTSIMLRVHPSNFALVGYTYHTSTEALASLAHERGLLSLHDAGSGALIRTEAYNLPEEPFVPDSVSFGVDLVTFSGDKLLGGPQAGIIVGKKELISQIKRNPLTRAMRIDKMTVAGLEATLLAYIFASGESPKSLPGPHSIPVVDMLIEDLDAVRSRAKALKDVIEPYTPPWLRITVEDSLTEVGGGSLPLAKLPTSVVKLLPEGSSPLSVNDLSLLLRRTTPPVISRISDDALILDVKTVRNEEIQTAAHILRLLLSDKS